VLAIRGDGRVVERPLGNCIARVLVGPLPIALVIAGALATQTRRGVVQVAGADCSTGCHGVADRVEALRVVTPLLVLLFSALVTFAWWRSIGFGAVRAKVALLALGVFALAGALAPFWSLGSIVSLVALVVAIFVRQSVLLPSPSGPPESFEGVIGLRGVRVTVVAVAVYALFLLVIPQSSPQAIDAMLAWTSHITYVGGAVASAVLLSLVVHDSALGLASPAGGGTPIAVETTLRRSARERAVLQLGGLVLLSVLVLLTVLSYLVWYDVVFVVGIILLLEACSLWPSAAPARPEATRSETVCLQIAGWLRMIAQVPLVLFLAALVLTLGEAIIGGDIGGVAALTLAAVAVVVALVLLERGARDDALDARSAPPPFAWPALLETQWWASVFMTVVYADRYESRIAGPALFVGAALLGVHLWRRRARPGDPDPGPPSIVLRYLGFVPAVALTAGTLADWPGVGFGVALATIAAALVIAAVLTGKDGAVQIWAAGGRRGLGLPIAAGAGIALLVSGLTDIVRTSTIVGTIAAINIAAAAVVAILHALVERTDAWYLPAPDRLQFLRGRRIPILTVLTAWIVVAIGLSPPPAHRMQVTARAAAETPTIEDAMTSFLARPAAASAAQNPRPILLVASDGGGARASYWTALVLDCVVAARPPVKARDAEVCTHGASGATRSGSAAEQRARARSILLVSGVSGGGVGLAQYAGALVEGKGALPDGWAEDVAGYDMLRAPMTWGVSHDLVAALLGLHAPDEACLDLTGSRPSIKCRLIQALTQDRGTILARSIAGEGGRNPLPPVRLRDVTVTPTNDLPVYVDNATLAGGVARVLASPLNLGATLSNNLTDVPRCGRLRARPEPCDPTPVTRVRDLVDVLGPRRDMSLYAASTLGARFPVITAPGFVASCDSAGSLGHAEGDDCEPDSSMSDGGFLENSGLLTIHDLLPDIRQRVTAYNAGHARKYAIYVVELDNHAQRDADTGEIDSARVATTVLNLTSARDFIEGYAREAIVDYVGSDCYLRVHPSISAAGSAPTGWLLSDDAERGLAQSLLSTPVPPATVAKLTTWIDGATTKQSCVP
jgi:hypothetical protein